MFKIILSLFLYMSTSFSSFIKLDNNNINLIEEKDKKESIYKNIKELNLLIKELKNEENIAIKFTEINYFVNKNIRDVSDFENYKVDDYWATPLETLINGGDCEDYAILKYLALLNVGINEKNLMFVVLKDNKFKSAPYHMALLYFEDLNSIPFVFDNATYQIKKISEINYSPVFGFNELSTFSFYDNKIFQEISVDWDNQIPYMELIKSIKNKQGV